jgi:hypothetical protein
MNKITSRYTAIALALLALGARPAAAVPLSGLFTKDNDLQFFTFTLSSSANTTIATTSFANDHGFVPWLYLWNAYGVFVQQGTNTSNSDSTISENLAAGTYYGVVHVSENFFNGLDFTGAIDGVTPFASVYNPAQFFHSGALDTDDQFLLNQVNPQCSGSVPGNFFVYDITGCENRSGNWALNITVDTPSVLGSVSPFPSASVPEPATLSLALAGLAGFAPRARRRTV